MGTVAGQGRGAGKVARDGQVTAAVPVSLRAADVLSLVREASGRRVAVIGDVIVDRYVYGEPVRISREAPVLILRYTGEEERPGGAANAAANAAALGARASVVGLVGADGPGRRLGRMLQRRGLCVELVEDPGRPTTVKTRVVAAGRQAARQQVLRIDRWEAEFPEASVRRRLADAARQAVQEADAVILSEYGGGALSPEVVEAALAAAARRATPVVADSRYRLLEFRGVHAATPNLPEAEALIGRRIRSEQELVAAGRELLARLGARALVLTRGDEGMSVFLAGDQPPLRLMPYRPKEVYDVSGAGDTVVASVALGLACGEDRLVVACLLADLAAGLVVGKQGVAVPDLDELREAALQWQPEGYRYATSPGAGSVRPWATADTTARQEEPP